MYETSSRLKSLSGTLAAFLVCLCLSACLILYASMLWGCLLFCVFAVFVGIPLSSRHGTRWIRSGLFMAGMLFFLVYITVFVQFDPFATSVSLHGIQDTGIVFSVESKAPIGRRFLASTTSYFRYTCNAQDYWTLSRPDHADDGMFNGHFISAPLTERTHFQTLYEASSNSTQRTEHLGYILTEEDAPSAVGKQNRRLLLFVLCFLLLLCAEAFASAYKRR